MNETWVQRQIRISAKPRGFHLITGEILREFPETRQFRVGIMHVFIQHTSASLTINENADPDVLADFRTSFDRLVPENQPFVHTMEGPDDMPAHIKSALLGSSLSIPIANGALALGTWQGIYLCEHRNHGGARSLVVTAHGVCDAA